MRRKTIKVSYTTKTDDGFLIDNYRKFYTMTMVINFMKELRSKNIIGKPIVHTR